MSKINQLKYLKKTKARVAHQCNNCESIINVGGYYYKESVDDKFLQSLHARDFCTDCYVNYGETLLNKRLTERKSNNTDKSLMGFLQE
jgi:hypothetical protein